MVEGTNSKMWEYLVGDGSSVALGGPSSHDDNNIIKDKIRYLSIYSPFY